MSSGNLKRSTPAAFGLRLYGSLVFAVILGFFGTSSDAFQNTPSSQASSSTPVRFASGGNAAAIPPEFIDQLLFLPVRVNDGKASLFELDSSARETSIDPGRAKALALDVQYGGDAPASGMAVLNCVLNLPGVEISRPVLPVLERENFGAQVGKIYEGTLGSDFFERFVIQIDYARRTLQIFDPNSFHYSGHGTTFPVTFMGGMPIVHAKFSTGSRKDIEADFALNTALDSSVLIPDQYAETHRLFSAHRKTFAAVDGELGSAEQVAYERAKDFRLGPYALDGTILEFAQNVSLPPNSLRLAGEIGGGMLRRFIVTFDYAHKTVTLEPNSNFQTDDQEDKSGISLIAQGPGLKRFQVVQVQPGTPAAEAGMRVGDIIVGIDEDAAADLTLADVRDLFRQVGHKYNVLIERGGKTMPVEIQMKRLLD